MAVLVLLPCRGNSGLGYELFSKIKELAGSPVELTISAVSVDNLIRLEVNVTSRVSVDEPSSTCPLATYVDFAKEEIPRGYVQVKKKVTNDDYTFGSLSYNISKVGGLGDVELFERFPFFMTPLISSLTVSDPRCEMMYDLLPCSPVTSKRDVCLHVLMSSALQDCQVKLDFLREFIRSTDFTFVAEKGFDVNGIYYREAGESLWQVSNSVIDHVVTPDFSMNYNTLALCLAVSTLIYGAINRRFTNSVEAKPSLMSRLFAAFAIKFKRE